MTFWKIPEIMADNLYCCFLVSGNTASGPVKRNMPWLVRHWEIPRNFPYSIQFKNCLLILFYLHKFNLRKLSIPFNLTNPPIQFINSNISDKPRYFYHFSFYKWKKKLLRFFQEPSEIHKGQFMYLARVWWVYL